MKTSLKSFIVLAAFGTFAVSSCSDQTKQNAEATADSAANDVSNATDEAAAATNDATDNVKADMAPEPGDTAVVQNKEADKLVEEMPAKQQ